ncbi:hypothetical protein C1752_03761 [Acaryochloris thomasi RCC1774]|uniref:Uncharacterized protein n=1 Tax=Acaryochloris thomasi RCC1774 TaxID=1764569 RepID=A0A2W1JL53_9CYAN|nr:hypothetical protein C1752_03761 [Acaryochloris thomasi RCC1774]
MSRFYVRMTNSQQVSVALTERNERVIYQYHDGGMSLLEHWIQVHSFANTAERCIQADDKVSHEPDSSG